MRSSRPAKVTAWVALTDAPVEAGCMEVAPRSHKLGQLPHAELQDTDNLLSRGQHLAGHLDRRRTVYMPVVSKPPLHHTHLVHTRPNRSTHPRIGLGISYIPTSARCVAKNRLTAMLVRGVDRYGHWTTSAGRSRRRARPSAPSMPRRCSRFRAMNVAVRGQPGRRDQALELRHRGPTDAAPAVP